MPLVRIDLGAGTSAEQRRHIADAVHQALVETCKVPPDDRFQVVTAHAADALVFDRQYLGVARSDGFVVVQISLNLGRTVEMKQALYRRMAELVHERAGVRREDLMVNLIEVAPENWSFGNGEAQYVKR